MDAQQHDQMLQKMRNAPGFIAALDQSGGSTPKTLGLYGVTESSWSNEQEMFDLIHRMRCRIITSPAFDGRRILAAILFEMTMNRQVEGKGAAEFLWQDKQIVPFLKIDKGLAEQADGVQLIKPIPDVDALLKRALRHGMYGTKMRSVVALADPVGIQAVVEQQFAVARTVLHAGLVPIIEPEVDIHSPQKLAADELLTERLLIAPVRARRGPAGHAEALATRTGQPVRPAARTPTSAASRCSVRWLYTRRGERSTGPQRRCHRQLLPRPHRGPVSAAEPSRVRPHPRQLHPGHL